MNKTILKGFIGTYTNTDSRGIYNFEFDCENKVFKTHALAYEIEKPSYLAVDKENNILYSVSKDNDLGGVTSFKIKENLSLEKINSVLETENPPCYINFSNKQGLIFTANYHHNKINVYPIEDGHRIGKPIKTLTHTNNTPHIHYANLDLDENFLLTVDLGQDYINLYEIKENDFIEREDLRVKFSKGCGPRHLAFHPNGKFIYVLTELSSEIASFQYNKGYLKLINILSTLPNKYTGVKSGAAIHIHPNVKFIYTSDRGNNSIACFKIDNATGSLSLVEHKPTFGSCPRDFAISEDGKYILITNQDSSSLVIFEISEDTGRLINHVGSIEVPSPVCIKLI